MKLITITRSDTENPYVKEFDKKIFTPSFPNENERERIEDIVRRCDTEAEDPITLFYICINDHKVIGGGIIDYYKENNNLEYIYIVVKDGMRGKGIGSWIFHNSIRQAIKTIQECYHQTPDLLFLETENPEDKENNHKDSVRKVNMYKRWNLVPVNIDYVQPPLHEGLGYARNLLLLYMELNGKLTPDTLEDFLVTFYKGLGRKEDDKELIKMRKQIKK